MWCPKCKNEYVSGVTECADCHVPLVDTLPETADRKEGSGFFEGDESTECTAEESGGEAEESGQDGPSSHAYISKKTKTEDMKSTAYTFTLVGGLGLVFLALFALGILPVQVAGYMRVMICVVMGALFVIFLAVGIWSFRQLNPLASAAKDEENLFAEITAWFQKSYTLDTLDAGLDLDLPEEQLYFMRYERMRSFISGRYPQLEEAFLDHIIETLYADFFS